MIRYINIILWVTIWVSIHVVWVIGIESRSLNIFAVLFGFLFVTYTGRFARVESSSGDKINSLEKLLRVWRIGVTDWLLVCLCLFFLKESFEIPSVESVTLLIVAYLFYFIVFSLSFGKTIGMILANASPINEEKKEDRSAISIAVVQAFLPLVFLHFGGLILILIDMVYRFKKGPMISEKIFELK